MFQMHVLCTLQSQRLAICLTWVKQEQIDPEVGD